MPSLQLLPTTYHEDSAAYFRRLYELPGAVWLDSGKQRFYNSRYDILTALPVEQVASCGDTCAVRTHGGRAKIEPTDTLTYLERRLQDLALDDTSANQARGLPFSGGAIGYLSYEALHSEFSLNGQPEEMPDIFFGIYEWALVQDHKEKQAYLCFLSTCDADFVQRIKFLFEQEPAAPQSYTCLGFLPDISCDTYISAVERIQDYIRAGDCYQVNFTQRFTSHFQGSTASAYLRLREALPSPFSAYYQTPAGTILSLSPERFLERQGQQIKTQPIKGTTPRGDSVGRDEALAQELRQSEKNRAENLMIVDLLRNDLSKVSEPFSVKVPELFGLQSFANVHHLVSTVTSTLRGDVSQTALLKACFPGGSITGAPKKRAMEIIDELETHRRGIYCGSIMYMSLNGRMDSSIAIRTLIQKGQKIHCWGGGGIVADSDPAMEYQESLHKIGLLLETLQKH